MASYSYMQDSCLVSQELRKPKEEARQESGQVPVERHMESDPVCKEHRAQIEATGLLALRTGIGLFTVYIRLVLRGDGLAHVVGDLSL